MKRRNKGLDKLDKLFDTWHSIFWEEMDLNIDGQKLNKFLIGKRETNIMFNIVYKEEMKFRKVENSEIGGKNE